MKCFIALTRILGSKSRDRKRAAEVSMRNSDQCSSYRVTIFAAMHLPPSLLNSIMSGAIVLPSDGTSSGFFNLDLLVDVGYGSEVFFFF